MWNHLRVWHVSHFKPVVGHWRVKSLRRSKLHPVFPLIRQQKKTSLPHWDEGFDGGLKKTFLSFFNLACSNTSPSHQGASPSSLMSTFHATTFALAQHRTTTSFRVVVSIQDVDAMRADSWCCSFDEVTQPCIQIDSRTCVCRFNKSCSWIHVHAVLSTVQHCVAKSIHHQIFESKDRAGNRYVEPKPLHLGWLLRQCSHRLTHWLIDSFAFTVHFTTVCSQIGSWPEERCTSPAISTRMARPTWRL